MTTFYDKFYPKPKTGKECKKTECARYDNYVKWNPGDSSLQFCMACKYAYVSQYQSKGATA